MMKLLSTCFLTAALYGTEAQADTSLPAATPFAGVDKKLPMLELLPVGQVLPKVSLSRYEGPRLSMLLTASSVTVAAPQEIAANILNVYLYGKTTRPPTFSRRPPLIFWIKNWPSPIRKPPSGKKIFPPKGPAFTWTPISRGASFWVPFKPPSAWLNATSNHSFL